MMPGAASIAIGAAQFSASSTTTLACLNAGTPPGLLVMDRSGMTQRPIGLTDQDNSDPAISPDGSRIAFVSSGDIWVEDLDRPRRTRLSDDGASIDPLWSPDGQRLLYASHPTQVDRFLEKNLSNGAVRQWAVDVGPAGFGRPQAWLADGRVLYSSRSPSTLTDVWVADPSDARKSFPLVNSRFNDRSAAPSPDGRWLAYTSDETGRQEVWVRRMDGSSPPGNAHARGRAVHSLGAKRQGGLLDHAGRRRGDTPVPNAHRHRGTRSLGRVSRRPAIRHPASWRPAAQRDDGHRQLAVVAEEVTRTSAATRLGSSVRVRVDDGPWSPAASGPSCIAHRPKPRAGSLSA